MDAAQPLLIAQFDPGDWIQVVIVALVMVASALGPVLKVLIKKFSPPEEVDSKKEDGERTLVRRPPPPDRPMARPMPPRTAGRRVTIEVEQDEIGTPRPPQRGLPEPLREILAEILPDVIPPGEPPLPPARPRPVQRSERTAPQTPDLARPARPIPTSPRPSQPTARKAARPQSPSTAPRRENERQAARPARRAPRPENAGSQRDDVSTQVESNLGQLESRITRTTDAAPPQSGLLFDLARLRDRSNLRQAIILSEILAPPLALRSPTDSP